MAPHPRWRRRHLHLLPPRRGTSGEPPPLPAGRAVPSGHGAQHGAQRGRAAPGAAAAGAGSRRALQPRGRRPARRGPPGAGGRREEPAGAGRGDRGGGADGHALGAERRGRGGAAGRQPRGAAVPEPARGGAAAARGPEAARGLPGLQQGHGQQVGAAGEGSGRRAAGAARRAPGAGRGAAAAAAAPGRGGPARARARRAQEEEAAAGSDPQVLLDPQGQRLQHGRAAAARRAHRGHDRHGLLAPAALQTLQLLLAGAAPGLRAPAPAAQGALGAAPDLPGDGLHGDAHGQFRGELLLELRRALPAAAAPGPRPARHLLPAGPRRSPPVAPRLLLQGEEGALAGRLRLTGVQVRVEGGGGAQEPAEDAHHVSQRPRAVPAGTAGEVHPREAVLHRPRVPQREPGRHAPGRVPPGRGAGGRPGAHPGPPHGHPAPVLHQAGDLAAALQTRLQPLHGAQHGGVQLPPGAEEVGGGGELGGLPPRAAAAHGAPRQRLRHRLGALAGAPHHDQIRHQQHPRARGAPRQPADGLRQPHVPPGRVTPPRGSPPSWGGVPSPGVPRPQ